LQWDRKDGNNVYDWYNKLGTIGGKGRRIRRGMYGEGRKKKEKRTEENGAREEEAN
jgi:hypothetical protein